MRFVRALSLAGLAALMAIAVWGTASASATAMCETEPTAVEEESGTSLQCPDGSLYGIDVDAEQILTGALAVDSPHGEGEGEMEFHTPIGVVSCSESSFELEAESSGSPVEGQATKLSFGSCATTIPFCAVEAMVASLPFATPIAYEGLGTSGPNGSTSLEAAEVTTTFLCMGSIEVSCTYEGEPAIGGIYNPGNENAPSEESGVVDFEAPYALTGESSESCPAVGELHVTYTIEAPESASTKIYVAQKALPTKLCKAVPKVNAGVLECPANEAYAGDVFGTGLVTTTMTSTGGPMGAVECELTWFKGPFGADGTGGTEYFSFEGEGPEEEEPCGSSLAGTPNTTMKITGQPFGKSSIEYNGVVNPQGRLWLLKGAGVGNIRLVVEILIAEKATCTYKWATSDPSTTAIKNASGADPTTWTVNRSVTLEKEEPPKKNKCPTKGSFASKVALTGAGSIKIYVASK